MKTVRSSDGTPIAFDQWGEGSPLVYVGGALNDRSAGAPLAAILAQRFTVLSYDRRGRGASGDTKPYAVEREVEDLEALIVEAGGSAFVYGMSSGGALALEAAAGGLAITKLAIYEPPFAADDNQRRGAREYATKLTELLSAGRRGDAIELFMTMVGMPAEMIGQMRGAPMWPALEALAPSLAYDSAVMGDSSRGSSLPTERLAAVATPTLVLDGGASPAWMREMARRVANALPGGSAAAWKVRRTTWLRRRLLPCWRNSSPAETARAENGAATTGRRPAYARLGAGLGQGPSSRNVTGTRADHPGT